MHYNLNQENTYIMFWLVIMYLKALHIFTNGTCFSKEYLT